MPCNLTASVVAPLVGDFVGERDFFSNRFGDVGLQGVRFI